ncbi:ADP-ribose pyrophosphatase, partial [Streptococcus danieliae]|nr:ADP-ribose pyrophosphatase [Streptococcus danieliae]
DWVKDGTITDVKTVIGIFWLDKITSGAWQAA